MEPDQLLDQLAAGQTEFARLEAPPEPGVYGFFLATRGALPTISNPGSDALYIGLSSNLAAREFDTHFAAGQSGFSTLRRSLGALLRQELDLHPRPRGTGASQTNYRNYRFDDQGEQRLTDWMHQHLRVAVHALADPRAVETQLIALACPPLNLTGWANPDAPTIKALRKSCVEAAMQAERRG